MTVPRASAELRVLLLALRPDRPAARAAAAPLLAADLDPARLLRLAAAHGLSGHLQGLLDPGTLPAALEEELALRVRTTTARALLLREQARAAVALLAAAGVPALVLKGPAHAARWAHPALRESGDLDLLVRRADAARAWEALLQAGWRELIPVRPRLRRAVLGTEREQAFVGGGPLPLDLHWGLHDPHAWPGDAAREEADLWAEATSFQPGDGGPPLPGLGPRQALQLLVRHGAKHLWERLAWLVDLAAFAPQAPWGALAVAPGLARPMGLALRLAEDALGLAPPSGHAWPTDHPALVPVLRAVRAGWEQAPAPGALDSLRLQLRLREGVRARLRLALGELLTPTAEERALLPLPARLDPLLGGLRLARLLRKHVG